MPTYEYQCESCKTVFTKFLTISKMYEPETEMCPSCNKSNSVKKVILSGVIFNADVVKPNSAFTEKIKEIAKEHPRNTLKL